MIFTGKEAPRLALVILDTQRDHSNHERGGIDCAPDAFANLIRGFVHGIREQVHHLLLSKLTLPRHSPTFASSWLIPDTGLSPPVNTLVTLEDGEYFADGQELRYRFEQMNPDFRDNLPERFVLSECRFLKHTAGWQIDPAVRDAIRRIDGVHPLIIQHDSSECFEHPIANEDQPPTDICIIGRISGKAGLVTGMRETLQTLWKGARMWFITDLIRGPIPQDSEARRASSTRLFGRTFGLRGIPRHIKPIGAPDDPAAAVIALWSTRLTQMQAVTSACAELTSSTLSERFETVDICGNIIESASQAIPEYVDAEFLSGDHLSGQEVDRPSRRQFNEKLRMTRQSFVSFGYGSPPQENPFGKQLPAGRGALPFFGPNHLRAIMFVGGATHRFGYSDVFERTVPESVTSHAHSIYSSAFPHSPTRDAMAAWLSAIPSTRLVIIYRGYMPHPLNMLHAWVECTLFCVEGIFDPSPRDPRRRALPIEDEWVRLWEFNRGREHMDWAICDNPVSMLIDATESFDSLFSQDLLQFTQKVMHIETGAMLNSWLINAPPTASEILAEWTLLGMPPLLDSVVFLLTLSEASRNALGYENPHIARLFRSFRLQMLVGGETCPYQRFVAEICGREAFSTETISKEFRERSLIKPLGELADMDLIIALKEGQEIRPQIILIAREDSDTAWYPLFYKNASDAIDIFAKHPDLTQERLTVHHVRRVQKFLMQIATTHISRWLNAIENLTGRHRGSAKNNWLARRDFLQQALSGKVRVEALHQPLYLAIKF